VLLKAFEEMEITEPNTANQTCDMIRHYGWEVKNNSPLSAGLCKINMARLKMKDKV
jgi:glycosyltransferase A (GT-A) superfamily protein (DUF2064 family)